MKIANINNINKKWMKDAFSKKNHSCCANLLGIHCNNRSINSHSYWRKGISDYLAVDDKVYIIGLDNAELFGKHKDADNLYKIVEPQNANIFGGFCTVHDNCLFEIIEKNNYKTPFNMMQQFMFMVRALSYQIVHENDSIHWTEKLADCSFPDQLFEEGEKNYVQRKLEIAKNFIAQNDILPAYHIWIDRIKKCVSKEGENQFDEEKVLQLFGFRCYKLSGSLDFAALGVYFPPIVKEESQDETFIFNVIPGDECGYLLISYIPNSNLEKNEISIIDNIYREGTSEYMKQIVENIVLDQTENIILSPRIDEERLKEIAKHFLISSRYSAVINYMPISEQYKIMLAKKMDIFRKNRMVLFENHEQF